MHDLDSAIQNVGLYDCIYCDRIMIRSSKHGDTSLPSTMFDQVCTRFAGNYNATLKMRGVEVSIYFGVTKSSSFVQP